MFSFTIKHFIDCIALLMLYIFVCLPKWKCKRGGTLFIRTTMYIYLSFLLFFTMMPIITSLPFIFDHPYAINIIPFDDYANGRGDVMRQIVLNVVMTIPFGFLFPLTQRRSRRKLINTVIATFLLSLGIETLQPIINGIRSFDVTDLITNTMGGTIGYLGFVTIRPIIGLRQNNRLRMERKAFCNSDHIKRYM